MAADHFRNYILLAVSQWAKKPTIEDLEVWATTNWPNQVTCKEINHLCWALISEGVLELNYAHRLQLLEPKRQRKKLKALGRVV